MYQLLLIRCYLVSVLAGIGSISQVLEKCKQYANMPVTTAAGEKLILMAKVVFMANLKTDSVQI